MKSGQPPPPYRQSALEERKGNVSLLYREGKRKMERERERERERAMRGILEEHLLLWTEMVLSLAWVGLVKPHDHIEGTVNPSLQTACLL